MHYVNSDWSKTYMASYCTGKLIKKTTRGKIKSFVSNKLLYKIIKAFRLHFLWVSWHNKAPLILCNSACFLTLPVLNLFY